MADAAIAIQVRGGVIIRVTFAQPPQHKQDTQMGLIGGNVADGGADS